MLVDGVHRDVVIAAIDIHGQGARRGTRFQEEISRDRVVFPGGIDQDMAEGIRCEGATADRDGA
jgi:hypothetical protein